MLVSLLKLYDQQFDREDMDAEGSLDILPDNVLIETGTSPNVILKLIEGLTSTKLFDTRTLTNIALANSTSYEVLANYLQSSSNPISVKLSHKQLTRLSKAEQVAYARSRNRKRLH